VSHFSRTDEVQKLSDVEIPASFFNRIKTGSDALDIVLGGDDLPGVMPGSVWLVTGSPGAGKSTLMLQIMESIATGEGLSCLYSSGEESIQRVAHRARRIGIDAGSFSVGGFSTITSLEEFIRKNRVDVIVVDSLQALAEGEESNVHGLIKRFVNLSADTGATFFLIGHVTKSGVFSGKNKMLHDVDAHLSIDLNKDTGNRVIEVKKNRVGPSLIPYEFTMTGTGLDLRKLVPSEEPDRGGARPSPAAQEFLEEVKRLLRDGEKLSGYSHNEFESLRKYNRSGGFMRGALQKATAELTHQGFQVFTQVIDRREHFYIDVPTTNDRESK
jgi:predicted ATP-dependent serine protease